MRIPALIIITVAAAFVLIPVHSKQDYKLNEFSSNDLSQINETETQTQNSVSSGCSSSAVMIFQGQTGLYNGIPVFTVKIMNACGNDCEVSGVHVACGAFRSVNVINPNVFKRIAINDCLVNGGRPIRVGEIVQFKYITSFMEPLSVASVEC